MGKHSKRHQDRLRLGRDAIVSLSDAAALLPMSDDEARDWLRASGLVRDFHGRHVVLWGEVLDAIRELPVVGGWNPHRGRP